MRSRIVVWIVTRVLWHILGNYPDIVTAVLAAFGCHIHKNPKKREEKCPTI